MGDKWYITIQFDIKKEEHRNKLAYKTAFHIMMLEYKDTR